MIRIEPNSLYSRADLAAMLGPLGVDVDYFVSRVKPRKFLRMVWLGSDLLEAMRSAPPLAEREEAGGAAVVLEALAQPSARDGGRRGGKGLSGANDDPSAALKNLRRKLREEQR